MKCLVLRKSQLKVELESCDYRGFGDRFRVALPGSNPLDDFTAVRPIVRSSREYFSAYKPEG